MHKNTLTFPQVQDFDWSEVEICIIYKPSISSSIETARFPMTRLMTNVKEERYAHWRSFRLKKFLQVVRTNFEAIDGSFEVGSDWTRVPYKSCNGSVMDKFFFDNEDEFHLVLNDYSIEMEEKFSKTNRRSSVENVLYLRMEDEAWCSHERYA